MIEVYKILTGKEHIDSGQFFTLADNNYCLRGHDKVNQGKIETGHQDALIPSKNNQLMEQPASQCSQCKDCQWFQECV